MRKFYLSLILVLFAFVGVQAQTEIINETFNDQTGTGGNSGGWSGSGAFAQSSVTGLTGWALSEKVYAADKCLRVGTKNTIGTVQTPALEGLSGNATLTFKAGAWDNNDEQLAMAVAISGGGTITLPISGLDLTRVEVDINKAAWTEITLQIKNGTASTQISFESKQAIKARFFLDDVKVVSSGAITPPANYWTGAAGTTDWATVGNWSDHIPATGENLIFDAAATQDLVISSNIEVANFENTTDKKLIIAPAASLTVTGTITGYNTEADASKLLIQADGTGVAANGSFIVSDAAQVVYATVEMYSKAANVGPHSWIDNNPASPTNGTPRTVNYTWQFFGVPVHSVGTVAAAGFAKQNTTAPNHLYWISRYDEQTNSATEFYQKWTPMNAGSTLTKFTCYELTQNTPDKYTITGQLVFGDQNLTMTRHADEVTSSPSTISDERRFGLGQNIIANSYTSAIDVKTGITFDATDLLEKTVYIYNTGSIADWGTNQSHSNSDETEVRGLYMAIPHGAATPLWGDEIPSMQGFMIKFTPASKYNLQCYRHTNYLELQPEQTKHQATEGSCSNSSRPRGLSQSDSKLWLLSRRSASDREGGHHSRLRQRLGWIQTGYASECCYLCK